MVAWTNFERLLFLNCIIASNSFCVTSLIISSSFILRSLACFAAMKPKLSFNVLAHRLTQQISQNSTSFYYLNELASDSSEMAMTVYFGSLTSVASISSENNRKSL